MEATMRVTLKQDTALVVEKEGGPDGPGTIVLSKGTEHRMELTPSIVLPPPAACIARHKGWRILDFFRAFGSRKTGYNFQLTSQY